MQSHLDVAACDRHGGLVGEAQGPGSLLDGRVHVCGRRPAFLESNDLSEATLRVGLIVQYGLASSLEVLGAQVLCVLVVRLDERPVNGVRNHRYLHVRELPSEALLDTFVGLGTGLLLLK